MFSKISSGVSAWKGGIPYKNSETAADNALTSITLSSVGETGAQGEVWMMGSGLLTAGVAGGLVNIPAIGNDETTRCIWGIGGTDPVVAPVKARVGKRC